MVERIKYRSGYKHQLAETYATGVEIFPDRLVSGEFYALGSDGVLVVRVGYAWDGATGALDTPSFMRGSLVHDALYQMMGEGLLPLKWRKQADKELRRICREDGMPWVRAQWVYLAVRLRSRGSAAPKGRREIRTAP